MKTKINFINIQLYKYLKIIFTQEIKLYIIQYIYLLTHIKKQSMNISQKTYKNNYNPISVLQLPPKNTFIEVPTTNNEYSLLYQIDKKIYMEIYKLTIQKTKLFTNLEIYQWRKQTQFPISKNYYVNIKHNIQDNNNVQLIVYNQYCRSRLAGICQMNITQVLYMLKQSMLGFQRLVNKFGLFFINENMIRVNDKGLCRVWIHQNFSNNFPFRSQNNQQNMVKSTLQILQKYCNQSKIIKRLFSKLKQNKNFISVLRQVDNFVCSNKIIVPTKLTNFQNNKNIRLSPSKIGKSPIKTSQIVSQKTVRNSVVPLLKPTYSICQQDSISKQKFTRKNETQIKKIKSSQTIGLLNIMKKSDGQTTYKRNIKEIRPNNDTWHYNSTKQLQPPTWQESSFSRNKKWLEDFSLTIQQSEAPKVNHIQNKNKKQLTYSQSVVNPQNVKMRLNNSNNRSFCFKDQSNLPQLSLTKTLSKNSQQYSYADQFNNILQDSQKLLTASSALSPNRRLKRLDDDQNVEKLRTSHTQTVIKNNGWRSFTGLLEQHTQLNSSFHEGQQQNAYVKQIRLQKLEGLSRRGPTMSILPQDFDEIL